MPKRMIQVPEYTCPECHKDVLVHYASLTWACVDPDCKYARGPAASGGFDMPVRDKVICAFDGCFAAHDNHSWGKVRAHQENWYQMKDGTQYCPDHRPHWAPAVQ